MDDVYKLYCIGLLGGIFIGAVLGFIAGWSASERRKRG